MIKCPYCKLEFDSKPPKSRSLQQLRYYWGVVVELIAKETGYEKDEMHEILKAKYLVKKVILETTRGLEEVDIILSTTSLDTVDMETYLSRVRQFASIKLGVYVPLPNEVENEPSR